MKLLMSMALALVAWFSVPNQAAAATIFHVEDINPDPIDFFAEGVAKKTTFTYAYKFSFEGIANGVFGAISAGIKHLETAICLDATCSTASNVVIAGNTYSSFFGLLSLSGNYINDLAGGTYYLVVTGKTSKHLPGGFAGLLKLDVAPVPVPGALVLFLTAIGGLGVFGHFRRKKNAAA